VILIQFVPVAALNDDIQSASNIKYAAIVSFFAPARLFPGGIVTLGFSHTGPLVTIHHTGPDLCPTLPGPISH